MRRNPLARARFFDSRRNQMAVLLLVAACGGVQAQESEPPEGEPERRPDARLDPLLTDFSADEHMRDRLTRPEGGIAISPSSLPTVQQVVPTLETDPLIVPLADGSDARVEPGTIRPEGSFLVAWTGEIVRLRTGGLAFLPVAEAGSIEPEPAMALLPCGTYSRLEGLLGDATRGLWVSLTGEVMIYQDRNWILPTLFAGAAAPPPGEFVQVPADDAPDEPEPIEDQPTGESQPADDGDTREDPGQPDTPTSDDRVGDLIRELEAQREERRGIDTTFAPPRDAPPADANAAPGARVEGRMLLNQRGRMVRSPEGGWVVAIDNDGGQIAGVTLPNRLRLLPCKIVEPMEYKAETEGERWTFEVSGHLYTYGQTVYLLPRMFVSQPRDDVRALQ